MSRSPEEFHERMRTEIVWTLIQADVRLDESVIDDLADAATKTVREYLTGVEG